MSLKSFLKTIFNSEDLNNEDFICANCPIKRFKHFSDLDNYKKRKRVEKYCKKHFGDSVKVYHYFDKEDTQKEKIGCIKEG